MFFFAKEFLQGDEEVHLLAPADEEPPDQEQKGDEFSEGLTVIRDLDDINREPLEADAEEGPEDDESQEIPDSHGGTIRWTFDFHGDRARRGPSVGYTFNRISSLP